MSQKISIEDLEKEYNSIKHLYGEFKDGLIIQIKKLIEKNNFKLAFPIQSRVKEFSSMVEKINSKRVNIRKSISEMQDIVGIRIILLFPKDVENLHKLIQENLDIKKAYNTTDRLKNDQFGYSSLHLTISLPEEWLVIPTLKGMNDLIAELQIRTLSQHSWAEMSNILQYKQESSVPPELLRAINRVSALLETVDHEYERLLFEREKYKENLNLGQEISSQNHTLNVDILESILDEKLPKSNKDNRGENYSQLLYELNGFEITTIKQLVDFINRNITIMLELDKKAVIDLYQLFHKNPMALDERHKERLLSNSVFFSHSGLIRRALQTIDETKWEKIVNEK